MSLLRIQCGLGSVSYSDVAHEYVMHKASQTMVAGASFMLLGPKQTMVESSKPVIAVCAGRTGSGKSQTTRRVVEILRDLGKKVVVVRHPMPYGDLVAQKVQRFATYDDLDIISAPLKSAKSMSHILTAAQ